MGRACRAGGRVYLLEHGLGHYDFVNGVLERGSHRHADQWGCYWNRDILHLVSQAGLKVVSCRRLHFGTTYLLVCEPMADEEGGEKSKDNKDKER